MSFLAPAAFFLAALLPIIILMYLLKLRRTERQVSSTYLWRQMVLDVEANAPWQRLRRNLLLLLQLLFLITLILAIARPSTPTQGIGGQTAILVIDTSASMAATDVSPSRIEAAKDQAHRLVDGLSPQARVTVITAGDKARVVASSSADRRQVHQAINDIRAGAGGSDMGVALQIASAIAARQPADSASMPSTIILSDGNVTLPQSLSIKGALQYMPIGIRGNNQAISLLNLQRSPGGLGITAFAQVHNFSEEPVKRRIALYADGQLVDVNDLELPAGGEASVLVEDIISTTRQVEAQLLPSDPGVDYLSGDDHFIAIQRPAAPLSITLFSQGNLFLETALALIPGSQVTRFDPDEEGADAGQVAELPEAALTILDGAIPLTATLSQGSLLFIAPPRSTEYFQVTGMVDAPVAGAAQADDPLLRYVDLEGVNILDAVHIPLPGWARSVIVDGSAGGKGEVTTPLQTQGGDSPPLLFVGEMSGRRVAVLAFDLRHSDLPLNVAFPILVANLVQWLAPGRGGDIPSQVTPGTAVTLLIPPGSEPVVTTPDGNKISLEGHSGQVVFAETNQLGLYQVDLGAGEETEFAVNLALPQESHLEPTQNLPVTGLAGGQEANASQPAQREWWRVIAALALLVLTVEWLVYHRPTLAMLYRRLSAVMRTMLVSR